MKNIVYIILMGIIVGFSSCKGPEDIYEDYVVPSGLIYPGPALYPIAKPGDKRIEISWHRGTDPRVVKARVFWNNYTESVEVSIAPNTDIVSIIIDPIAENIYSFMIHTYDEEGNISIPVEVMGEVYGDNYRKRLTNRLLKSTYYDGRDLKLNWNTAADTETGTSLSWTDVSGVNYTKMIDPSETETTLPDFGLDKPLSYSTMYRPDSMAIDIIYAPKIETMIDPTIFISKATWAAKTLSGDMLMNGGFPLSNLWDGNTGNFMHSDGTTAVPITFTWDMGIKAKLSRMKLWPRNDDDKDRWNKSQPRIFEIYGSLTSLEGSWTLLGKFESIQPSGNGIKVPWVAPTAEDIALASVGLDFEFVPGPTVDPSVTVRYIRFKSLENFQAAETPRILLAEISLWGTLVR